MNDETMRSAILDHLKTLKDEFPDDWWGAEGAFAMLVVARKVVGGDSNRFAQCMSTLVDEGAVASTVTSDGLLKYRLA